MFSDLWLVMYRTSTCLFHFHDSEISRSPNPKIKTRKARKPKHRISQSQRTPWRQKDPTKIPTVWGPTVHWVATLWEATAWSPEYGSLQTRRLQSLFADFGSRHPMTRTLHSWGLHFEGLQSEPPILDLATQSLVVYTLGVYTWGV